MCQTLCQKFWRRKGAVYTYTAERSNVLGTSLTTKIFPKAPKMFPGTSRRPREIIFRLKGIYIIQPNTSPLEAVFSHSLNINPSIPSHQEIHPYWTIGIVSVKINPFLLMMITWQIRSNRQRRHRQWFEWNYDIVSTSNGKSSFSPSVSSFLHLWVTSALCGTLNI